MTNEYRPNKLAGQESNATAPPAPFRKNLALFAVRVWLVALIIFVFFAFNLTGMWMARICILMNTPVSIGTVESISIGQDSWRSGPYRFVHVSFHRTLPIVLQLLPNEPSIKLGEKIPVRVFGETGRYDSISELYELPRIAITSAIIALTLIPTFWALKRFKNYLYPLDTRWFALAVWVAAGTCMPIYIIPFVLAIWMA